MADQANHELASSSRDANFHWWEPAVAFFGGTLAGLLLTAMLGLVALVIAMRGGYRPDQAGIAVFIQTDFLANHLALVASDLGLAVVIWLIARRRIARPLARYFPPAGARAMALALTGGAALSLAINGGNELLSRITHIEFHDSVVERALVPHGPAQFIMALAVIALFAPFVEEFFFRGLFFTWLRQRGGVWLATLVSAATFAAVHGQVFIHPGVQGWLYSGELFLAGLALAWAVVRTGSLRTSWALHGAFNATAIVFSVLLP